MISIREQAYEDWTIRIVREDSMDSKYSYEITNPSGVTKHVDPGGNTVEEALERAKNTIDKLNSGSKYGVM